MTLPVYKPVDISNIQPVMTTDYIANSSKPPEDAVKQKLALAIKYQQSQPIRKMHRPEERSSLGQKGLYEPDSFVDVNVKTECQQHQAPAVSVEHVPLGEMDAEFINNNEYFSPMRRLYEDGSSSSRLHTNPNGGGIITKNSGQIEMTCRAVETKSHIEGLLETQHPPTENKGIAASGVLTSPRSLKARSTNFWDVPVSFENPNLPWKMPTVQPRFKQHPQNHLTIRAQSPIVMDGEEVFHNPMDDMPPVEVQSSAFLPRSVLKPHITQTLPPRSRPSTAHSNNTAPIEDYGDIGQSIEYPDTEFVAAVDRINSASEIFQVTCCICVILLS